MMAESTRGNWESTHFNLPETLRKQIPCIGDHPTIVIMHYDAVVQLLSEIPRITGAKHGPPLPSVPTSGTPISSAGTIERSQPGNIAHQTPIFRLRPTITIMCESLEGWAIADDDTAPH
jgi:hypothetical protein